MANCFNCGDITRLHISGVPVCVKCFTLKEFLVPCESPNPQDATINARLPRCVQA